MRPNYSILIVSLFLTIAVYFGWYEFNKSTFDSFDSLKIVSTDEKKFYNSYDVFYKLVKQGKNSLVFVAKDNIEINISSPLGDIQKNLSAGEAYFINVEENQSIWVDKPYSMEVFINDEDNTFVGVFEDLVS